MAEIEFRLPSKVPYGYANLVFQVDEQPTPEILGTMYANYVLAFAEAERAALNSYGKAPSVPLGDVFKPVVDQEPDVHESAVQAVTDGLGATVIEEQEEQGDPAPPWEKKAEAPEPKPWEKKAAPAATEKKAATKVANIEF